MSESVQETHAREKAWDFVEDCLRAGWGFDEVIRALKQAWVGVHEERAYYARKDMDRKIKA